MDSDSHELARLDTGARIRALRDSDSRGLSQAGLAKKAGVSVSLLGKVEAGLKPASPEFVAAVARALGVDEERLSWLPPGNDPILPKLASVRAALDLLDLPPAHEVHPRPLSELAADVRRVNAWSQAARYEQMVTVLPGLLAELHTATETVTAAQAPAVWALLATAARCGHSVGIALHRSDLSATALQKMDWAAIKAGDQAPGLRAVREYLRCTAYLRQRDLDACWRLSSSGFARLDGTDTDTPGAQVARGQLHLGAAILAAYSNDPDTMQNNLAEAERIAQSTGEQIEQWWLGFGPTNVRVHRVMALGVLGEHGRAVEAANGLRFPNRWLPTRIGHHYLDLARALRWLNRPEDALTALHMAREAAPGQARRHPLTHDTVNALLKTKLRRTTELNRYAAWITS